MRRMALHTKFTLLLVVIAVIGSGGSGPHAVKQTPQSAPPGHRDVLATYATLPLSFEVNEGQTDRQVRFLSRGSGYSLYLTSNEAVLALRKQSRETQAADSRTQPDTGAVLRMKLVGANSNPEVAAVEELPSKSNYFIGNDPTKWRTDVPSYAKVRYEAVYPGVDLVYYGNQQQLEYDFVVAPGADPAIIALDFAGADQREIDRDGDLVLRLGTEQVRFRKPFIYQQDHGTRRQVPGRYVLSDSGRVHFQVATYDPTQPLVIDPVLSYSTYLGGTNLEWGFGIAADASGHAYVTGRTGSTNFPTLNAFDSTGDVSNDAFVTKIDTTASGAASLVYSTYLGSATNFVNEQGLAIAVDSSNNAYVTGFTTGTTFPVVNAYKTTHSGGVNDAFVTKLNSAGNVLLYSTYLGGSVSDKGNAIAVDSFGNAYVTGETTSALSVSGTGIAFPTTASAYQTLMGGTGFCCILDAFVTKLNTTSSGTASLVYSTYLGGTAEEVGLGIAADAFGNAYVTGWTHTPNYFTKNAYQPAANSFQDAFVVKMATTASGAASLVYATYLGGNDHEYSNGIAVDSSGNMYVTGQTVSSIFPTMNAYDTSLSGTADAFVAKLNPAASGAASLLYSTYLGGSSTGEWRWYRSRRCRLRVCHGLDEFLGFSHAECP